MSAALALVGFLVALALPPSEAAVLVPLDYYDRPADQWGDLSGLTKER